MSDVATRVQLPADAGLIKSLGANHSFESALADLVDNSLDAGTHRIEIRLLTKDDLLCEVHVIDDGLGMNQDDIDAAMTIGHRREYSPTEHGHFGVGLKAASLAHANTFAVWSQRLGYPPVGRRIQRDEYATDFSCDVMTTDAAEIELYQSGKFPSRAQGTVVVWQAIRNAYQGVNKAEAQIWLQKIEQSVRTHLGIVFHRLIDNGTAVIELLVDDVETPSVGVAVPIVPIDPFGYAATGHPAYPKTMQVQDGASLVNLVCHIWPPKSDITGFRMGSMSGESQQGIYVYRNDRLLHVGGWAGVTNANASKQLARVLVEDSAKARGFLSMNSEKSHLKFEPAFHSALAGAVFADGGTFDEYMNDAVQVFTEANKRRRSRKPAITPDKGFVPLVRKRIRAEIPMISGTSLSIKWRRMNEGEFLEVQLSSGTLWLNAHYRHLFTERSTLNDAPVLKALLYLLTHEVFEGQHLGARDKDHIALWNEVLGAAVVAEEENRAASITRTDVTES